MARRVPGPFTFQTDGVQLTRELSLACKAGVKAGTAKLLAQPCAEITTRITVIRHGINAFL
jgi:hypothetical protein